MDDATRSALLAYFDSESGSLTRASERIRAIDEAPQLDESTTAQFVHGFTVIAREALEGRGTEAYDLYTEGAAVAVSSQQRTVGSLANSFAIAAGVLSDEIGAALDPASRQEAVDWLSCFVGKWAEDVLNTIEDQQA